MGYELRTIVISQCNAFGGVLPKYLVQQPDDLFFSNAPPQHLSQNTAGVHIQNSQKQGISFFTLDIDVLDIHTQLLHRTHRLLNPETDKLPLFAATADHCSTEQMLFFHQPVDLLFVNQKAIRVQILTNLHISSKEHELFPKHKSNADDHTFISNAASICQPGN